MKSKDKTFFGFGRNVFVAGLAMFPASLIGGWLWDHVSPAATFYNK